MIKPLVGTLGIAALCIIAADPASAQGQGRGRSSQPEAPATATIVVQFGAHDRDLIARYFAQPTSSLPPGLAKRHDGLPPGLEKQLQRNGTLPPGLQKKFQPFPVGLERQLAPLPAGYVRGVIGSHIVIYKSGTNVLVDVVLNIAK